jgi:ribosomal protein L37AE/L43A
MLSFDNSRFEQMDRVALFNALLALHECPKCRVELSQVKTTAKVFTLWNCGECETTWQVPNPS